MSAMTNARITRAPLAVATASYTTPPPSSGTIQETLANASFTYDAVGNPMTTAAAIDRLVHHSVILEFDVPSDRTEDAKKRETKVDEKEKEEKPSPKKARAKRAA